jgi:hypothetical protein
MVRRLVAVLCLVGVAGVTSGCKDDSKSGASSGPPKGLYNQQQQYKAGGAGTNTTAGTATTP